MTKVTISISVLITAPFVRSIYEMRSGARDGCTYLRYILGTPFSLSFELLMTDSHNDMTLNVFAVHILMLVRDRGYIYSDGLRVLISVFLLQFCYHLMHNLFFLTA